MGLDVSAVSQLEKVEVPEGIELWSDEYYDWEGEQEYSLWYFRETGVFDKQSQGLEEGAYNALGEGHNFRAGSYSGYGMWRDELAHAAGYFGGVDQVWKGVDSEGYSEKPFEELLNFSDAEGWIGPITSKKLYKDFVDNEKQIMDTVDKWVLMKGHPDHTPSFLQRREEDQFSPGTADYTLDDVRWFRVKYQDWKKAFELASNNGAVIFH
tara:strand:- start:722 stop:1351 length:630 start_codon:yes stop_codon:yes gene_type:complete